MTVICEAVAELLEPDLSITPPCQAWVDQVHSVQCGCPSAVCLHISCFCGVQGAFFLCSTCFRRVRTARACCGSCKAVITQWREV